MTWIKATPYARKIAKQYHIDLSAVEPTGPDGEVRERDVIRAKEGHRKTREVSVTPLAERIAANLHIRLDEVRGTGIGGRISKADVLAAGGKEEYTLKPGELRQALTGMRKTIAERMEAGARVPTATITTKVDVTDMLDLKDRLSAEEGVHYTVNDFVLAAVARALAKNKRILCSFAGDSIIYKTEINLGMAVALDDGLLVPVIREADTLTLKELAERAHELAERTRGRRISARECDDSTFTVSNMGMYGVEAFTPILNLPNAAILGVCSIYDGVTVEEGAVKVRKLMHICLTFDHRLMDGAVAAKFNLSVREHLENPESLL